MTTAAAPSTVTASAPPGYPAAAWRAFLLQLALYRHIWHGTLFSSVLLPILYMVSIGIGVGSYIDPAATGGITYAEFIAPGLVCSVAVMMLGNDMVYPVFGGYEEWGGTYLAQRATPLRPVDILNGHLIYAVGFRPLTACTVVAVVLAFFGVYTSPWAPLAVAASAFVSIAIAPWLFAWCSSLKNDAMLNSVFRFAIMPITLFSGVFFPAEQMPGFLQPLVWASPLWHGTELARAATADVAPALPPAAHLAYLVALAVGGWFVAKRVIARRLSF
ncbi:ABC transporter permease [Glycomyces sp. L485]|uniref:ABC transporter permease n=1 Tax=Glycomyces sp. L485 TaxID=2909235 RepID=UPI001F4B8D8C|nr:ABC transporter permease [Glycomyces sp. L485]MCH7231189.1 ABC transporter permease [Glycomyces sp. L485]